MENKKNIHKIIGEVHEDFVETVYISLKSDSIISQELDDELEATLFDHFKGKKVKITIEEIEE